LLDFVSQVVSPSGAAVPSYSQAADLQDEGLWSPLQPGCGWPPPIRPEHDKICTMVTIKSCPPLEGSLINATKVEDGKS